MQQVPGEPFLHVSPDHLVASGMLPGRRDPDGPFAWWDLWCVRSAPSL
jgi:chloramphenicol 3-O phosphotransferase